MKKAKPVVTNRFSALLGERREKISDVARATGISRTTLTNFYYDRHKAVSLNTLSSLCEYFGCGVGDLLVLADRGGEPHETDQSGT